jgi:hypothetical protein
MAKKPWERFKSTETATEKPWERFAKKEPEENGLTEEQDREKSLNELNKEDDVYSRYFSAYQEKKNKEYSDKLSKELEPYDQALATKPDLTDQKAIDEYNQKVNERNSFADKRSAEINQEFQVDYDNEVKRVNNQANNFEKSIYDYSQRRQGQEPVKPVKLPIQRTMQDPFGVGETIARQIYSGITDQIPKSFAQASEVGVSAIQSANIDEYIKRSKSDDFQRYVRSKDADFVGDGGFIDKAKGLFTPFDIDKYLGKYKDEFIQDQGLQQVQKNLERKNPEVIKRRLDLEKYVQQQNQESQEKMGGIPQSYKNINSVPSAVQYAANMAAQGLWQIPLVIATKGLSGVAMESSAVYDEQLDKIAEEKGMSREEVISKNLDKPAEGQFYAVAAAGLDKLSAGKLLDIVKKGGAPLAEKLIAITTETLTEPLQGTLEEMGGASGANQNVADAFEKAWTVNLSRRIDESAGGFFGSVGPTVLMNNNESGNNGTTVEEIISNPVQRNEEQPAQQINQEPIQPGADQTGQANAVEPAPVLELSKEQQDAKGRIDEFVSGLESANPELHKVAVSNPVAALNDLIEFHRGNLSGTNPTTKEYAQKAIDKFESLKKDYELANTTNETVGTNYQKVNGEWQVKQADGSWAPIISKNPNKTTEEQNTELTQLKELKRQLDEDEPQNLKMSNTEKGRIAQLEPTTVMGAVRKFFWDGGKVLWNSKGKTTSKPQRGIKDEGGLSQGDKKSIEQFVNDTHGFSVGQIAEKLAQQGFDEMEARNAVIEVLSQTDPKNWYEDHLKSEDPDYLQGRDARFDEANEVAKRIEELETQEKRITETNKQLYENERRVNRGSEEEGAGTAERVAGEKPGEQGEGGQTQAEPSSLIRENGNEDQSQQALEELGKLNLTHVTGLGMGQNQAKGTYVSTESENRYATEENKPKKVKVKVKKPFVTDSNIFATIQRAIIQSRFGKNAIEDLTDNEVDLLAEMVNEHFVNEGHDSIYFPQSETQEGELIVFDRNNVTFEDGQNEQPASEQSGGQRVPEEVVSEKPIDKGTDKQVDPPKSETVEEPNKKERKIAKRYLADESVSNEVKSGLSEEGRYYIPTTDLKRQSEADAYIEEKGVEQTIADITDADNGMSDQNRIFLGKTVYGLLKEELNNTEYKAQVRDKINRMMESIAQLGTRAGQTVQAFANMFTSDADQIAYTLQKEYGKQQNKALEYAEPEIQSLKSLIDLATDEALRDLMKDPRIQQLIEESRKADNTRQGKRKQFTKKVLDKLDELEKQIDDNLKSGRLNADITFGLLPLAYKAAINVIRAAVKAGDSLADAVERAIAETNIASKNWDEEAFRKQFESEIKEEGKRDRKTLLEVLGEMDETFKSLASSHYKNYSGKKKQIKTVLHEELGLSVEEAERLGNALDKIVGEKRKKIIEQKYAGKLSPKKKRVAKQLSEKIQEFTNLGVMSDQKLRDAYLAAIGLPGMTDAQATEMERLVQVAEGLPEGFQRFEAVQELIKHHQKTTPISWLEVGESIWYANMLSGISTQSLNFQANSVATLAETFTSAIQGIVEYKSPKVALANLSFLLKGMAEGYKRALPESANVLKHGYNPIKGQKFDESAFRGVKTSKSSVLEILDPKSPIYWWKYVGRLMAATDILFYGGLKGGRAHQLAFRDAFNLNFNTYDKSVLNKANESLSRTSSKVSEAKDRATAEGLTGRNFNRRVYEIIEQSWPGQHREDAHSFAAKGTYNYDPEGVLGVMTGVLNNATAKLPLLKTIVPFSRVISNVLNDYLNYTPWGLVRAAKGGMGIPNKDSFRRFNQEELLREKIKAITGTTAMVALYALSQGDDDDEPFLQITADGTGNLKRNYELGETGWTQYSFKVKGTDQWFSYQNTPLAIPFATIGHVRDASKYKDKEVTEEKLGMIASGTIHYMMDMSFVSGLSDFFQILGSQDIGSTAEKLAMFANRTVKTVVVPNAFTQVSRGVQEIIESPMKKGDGIFGQYYRDVPILRDNLNSMYNALGEPIVTETLYKFNPILTRVTSEADEKQKDSYKLWELIVENGAWIGAPSKNTKVYDPATRQERELSEDEYQKFSLAAGKYTKELLLNYYPMLAAEKDKSVVKKRIGQIKEQARERAKSEVFKVG